MTGSNTVRRSRRLAVAVGAALAGYASLAGATQWRFDNGSQVIWNTSISVGASWRARNPSNELFSRASGQLLGLQDGLGGSTTDSATQKPGARDRHVCIPTPRRGVPSRCVAVPMAAVTQIQ